MTDEPAMPTLPALPRWSWRRAVLAATGAVYGPQLLMGLFTLAFVACQHCRGAIAMVMVIAPGVELSIFTSWLFKFRNHPFSDAVILTSDVALTLLALAGVAAALRRWSRWRWPVFALSALAFAAGAALLLAMIRA